MSDHKMPETTQETTQETMPETTQETRRPSWVRRFWPLLTAAILSDIWIGICIWWFIESGKTLSRMPLYEVGGLLAGASLPLILFWLMALVFLRTDPLREQRTALTQGIEGLLAPLDSVQKRVGAIVAQLHKEIKHVEAASDIAATRLDNLENRFQEQISNLFDVTTDAEAKAANLQTTLSAERLAFSGLVAEITEHMTELETLFNKIKCESHSIASTTRKNSEEVSAEITFQNKALEERSLVMETQLEKMAATLVGLSSEISENCAASESNLINVSQTLSEKQSSLMENMTDLHQNADIICDKMDKQAHIIESISHKTLKDSEELTALIREQSTNLTAVAEEAIRRTNESGAAFQSQADSMRDKLDETTQTSKALLNDASDDFKSRAEEIVTSAQDLSDNLRGHMGRATDDLQTKSEILEHTISLRAASIEEALNNQAKIIHSALIAQSKSSGDFITNQNNDFVEGLESQFNHLMAMMGKHTEQLEQFSQKTTDQLSGTLSSLESQAGRVEQAVKVTTDCLGENTHKMDDHYHAFEDLSGKFRSEITLSETHMKTQHDAFSKISSDVIGQLDVSLQEIKEQSASLGEHAQQVVSSIVGQTEALSVHIDDIRGRTENTLRNIQEMGENVSTHFTATDAQAAALSENWVKTASLVENQCLDTLSKLDDLTQTLRAVKAENELAVKSAEENVATIASHMQDASESIFLASASAIEAADETNRVIDQHAEKFQQLINALQLSNKSILIDAEAIEQKNRHKGGAYFSELSSKIIEQLQSLSIDINRHFESEVPDKDWQSYVNGDKNIFVRRLKKLTNKKNVAALRDKYKTDPEFRKNALEYIHIFEGLMSHSMSSDAYSSFSIALISSETGKLYLALAQALDRFSK